MNGPTLDFERRLRRRGFQAIAGLDEAGRGAWAGPVVAAAVILPVEQPGLASALAGVDDSKKLSPDRREEFYPLIFATARAVAVGMATAAEVDELNVLAATRLAMARAVGSLPCPPDHLLVDAVRLGLAASQTALIRGDARSLSIAAASVVAKVTRDRLMRDLEAQWPGYGFARHKGYGTALHRSALERLGATDLHRRSYRPIRALSAAGVGPG